MVNRLELINVLAKIKPGIADKEIIEQTDHFIFEKERIWTYNDQISISQKFNSNLIGAVKATEFYNLLDKIEDEELDITMMNETFLIQNNNILINININPDIKIKFSRKIDDKKWQKLPDDFIESLTMCIFSTSSNMMQPELTCLWVNDKTIFSTDRFRATKKEMNTGVKTSFLIPALVVQELKNYKVNKIYLEDEGWLHFIDDQNTMFSCRTFKDVKYLKQLEKYFEVEGELIEFPDNLKSVIERVKILVTADFNTDKFISFTLYNNKLLCEAKGSYGSIKEKININYKGERICFKVNPDFFIDILTQIKSVIVGKTLLFQNQDKKFKHIICLVSD